MMKPEDTLKQFINDKYAYVGDETAREKRSPRLRLPNGLTKSQIDAIALRGREAILQRVGPEPLCLVAVASRGLPVAFSISTGITDRDIAVSVLQKTWEDEKISAWKRSHTFVVVDNTIKTGATLRRVAKLLAQADVKPELIVTFYHEKLSTKVERSICEVLGIPTDCIVPLFPAEEIDAFESVKG